MARLGGLAATALLLAALTGCAGGASGGGVTATAPATAAVSGLVTAAPSGAAAAAAGVEPVAGALLCDVLTSEEIRSATGVDTVSSVANNGTAGTECDYRGGDGSAVVVLQDQSQQLLPLGSTAAQVTAALQARGGATALNIAGADTALLSNATAVPGVFLLAHGHWFYLSLPSGSVSDPDSALTILAAQAVSVLRTEAQ